MIIPIVNRLFWEKGSHAKIFSMLWIDVRRRDVQLIVNFAVGRPEALQVLQVRPESERIPSNSLILAMSGQGTESPFIASVYSFQLMRNIYEKGIDPILPIIEAKGKSEFLIDKIALLDSEKIKMVLTPNETRLYNLLSRSNLRTNLPAYIEGVMYQYYTERSSSDYKILNTESGKATIRYYIKIKGILEESSSQDLVTHSLLKKIQTAGEKELEDDILALLKKFIRAVWILLGGGCTMELDILIMIPKWKCGRSSMLGSIFRSKLMLTSNIQD